MDEIEKFKNSVNENINSAGNDEEMKKLSLDWMMKAGGEHQYSYNFSWLGRPIIQYPQDIVALQEIIWSIQPDLIIETGIAHGGSLIFSASMLELNAVCGGPKEAKVIGVDIDIRSHNRREIEDHPLFRRIAMIEGSSIDEEVINKVKEETIGKHKILVILDSNHTHDHVLAELYAYAPLVSINSYCIVFDTVIENTHVEFIGDRPWGPGNSPKTAVHKFIEDNKNFKINKNIDNKLLISVAPDGYLYRTK